ncbi:YwiC-like protein [Actinoplanes regularis]|uniref:YwiC-like protein n=1 Tax=Actinoplanes regularis TaxID=52697 RepID=A0A238XG76_9ACTN|nr:YwiC-like protein [Actinoplanes regularis]
MGLLLAFVTFGFLASMWTAGGIRGAHDEVGARRFERRTTLTGVLAAMTAVVAVITEDPIRVAMFAILAVAMAAVWIRSRRRES